MNRIEVARSLVRMAAAMLQSEDTAEDIATDVVTRMNRGMNCQRAFQQIGYGKLYSKTRETDMPDDWYDLSKDEKIEALVKAIKKALKR